MAYEASITPRPALSPHDYTGTCWWCRSPADSREHRHKSSDLRREFNMAEYAAGDVVVVRTAEQRTVRGPGSRQLKFGISLCAPCNNRRSQPFDLAYDQFIEWYLANEVEVERAGLIRLDAVYGDWQTGTTQLLRYFVKHIGCRIADAGFTVPDALREFLDGRGEPVGLVCSFEINGVFCGISAIAKSNLTEYGTAGNLYLGPVTGELTRAEGHATLLRGWWGYHGLQLVWEWNNQLPTFRTNLVGPEAQLSLVEQKGRRGLQRVAQSGVRGQAWRAWYGLRRRIGLGPKLR
jgi:hypothetical protein